MIGEKALNRKKAIQKMAILYILLWFFGFLLLGTLSEVLVGLNSEGELKDWSVIFIIVYLSFISVMIYKLDPFKLNTKSISRRNEKQRVNPRQHTKKIISEETRQKLAPKFLLERDKEKENIARQERIKKNEILYRESVRQKEIEQKKIKLKEAQALELKLKELNISKKLYDKSKHYYNRTVFKDRLNPIDKWDLELIQTEEIHFLNQLGLISQDFTYPYWVNIITDELIKEHAFKLRNYQADKKIHIPKIAPLDDLKNTSQLVDLAILILEKKRFKNIRKLAKHEQFGVDIIAEKDDSNYAFKCKYLSRNKVGKNDIQQAAEGAKIHHYSQALMVTNSYFTKSAKITAENNDVMLCDRICLAEYILKTPPYDY